MRDQNVRKCLMAAGCLVIGACGGGGSTSVASIPPPPPTPTPTPTPSSQPTPGTIIPGNLSTQVFAVKGGTIAFSSKNDPLPPDTDDASQLHIRYDASTRQYQVQLPATSSWQPLIDEPNSNDPGLYRSGGSDATLVHITQGAATGYSYSALAQWGWARSDYLGAIAFGIPTAAGSVPLTGSADYTGQIAGRSSEMVPDLLSGPWPAFISGSINLSFDFGAGTLAGSMSPVLETYSTYNLPILSFANTVYSPGSTSFSGTFATGLAGTNSFSGQFTGPAAQELIGSFAFPYVSPVDGKIQQAGGGFVAKDH